MTTRPIRRAKRQDQSLIEGPEEAGVHHGGPHALLLQQAGGGQGRNHHRAIGHDQQVVAIGEQFTPADLQGLPALLHQRHALALTTGMRMAQGPSCWIEVISMRCSSPSSFGAITVKLGTQRR